MRTVTRRSAAREINVTDSHLVYWEKIGELDPEKIRVGKSVLVKYTPELIQKAKEILFQGKRRKLERELEENERRAE